MHDSKYLQQFQDVYDDIPCWNGIVRLLLGLIFLGDIVTSALLINEFHWMGFKYEQHYDAFLSSYIITFGIMILINNFDAHDEFSYKGTYPGQSVLFPIFRAFGLDSLYYLFDSAISFKREKGMDVRTQSAGKPRKLYIQIHSVISTFVCMHYFFWQKDHLSKYVKANCACALAHVCFGLAWEYRETNLWLWLRRNLFCFKFLQYIFEGFGRCLFFGATALFTVYFEPLEVEKPYVTTYGFFGWEAIAAACLCFILAFFYCGYCKSLYGFQLSFQHFFSFLLQRPAVDYQIFKKLEDADQQVMFFMGNGKGVLTALNALRLQVFLPLLWRIFEYIALWSIIFDYKAGDYLQEKFKEVTSWRAHANWFGGRKMLDIASLMYLVIIINSIHLFILTCSFIYFFFIQNKCKSFGEKRLPYGKTAFNYIMKHINSQEKVVSSAPVPSKQQQQVPTENQKLVVQTNDGQANIQTLQTPKKEEIEKQLVTDFQFENKVISLKNQSGFFLSCIKMGNQQPFILSDRQQVWEQFVFQKIGPNKFILVSKFGQFYLGGRFTSQFSDAILTSNQSEALPLEIYKEPKTGKFFLQISNFSYLGGRSLFNEHLLFIQYASESEKWDILLCEADKPFPFSGKQVFLKNCKGFFLGGKKEAQNPLLLVNLTSNTEQFSIQEVGQNKFAFKQTISGLYLGKQVNQKLACLTQVWEVFDIIDLKNGKFAIQNSARDFLGGLDILNEGLYYLAQCSEKEQWEFIPIN